MASEILSIPEDYLEEVIDIIRVGLRECEPVNLKVKQQLTKWCDEEQAYLERLRHD